MRDLKENVVVIPGASGGVGQEICQLLADKGCKLVIGSNEGEKLDDLATELEKKGVDVTSMELDITDEEQVKSFLELGENQFGKLDILLNLPGISIPAQISEMKVEEYEATMDVNLKGSFLCAKHFISRVDEEHGGQIINIGSMAGKRANSGAPLYCTAKAAVNMFSDGLALQVQEKNIRVTTLNPGPINSSFWGDRDVPRNTFLKPKDAAEIILFVLTRGSNVVFHEISFDPFEFIKNK